MQELEENLNGHEGSRGRPHSRKATLRLVVLALAGAVVVALMLALVGPGLGG